MACTDKMRKMFRTYMINVKLYSQTYTNNCNSTKKIQISKETFIYI